MSKKLLNRRNRWIIGGAAGLLIVGGSATLATAAFADDGDDAVDNGSQVAHDDDDYDDDDDDDRDDDGDDDGAPATEPKVSLSDASATASDEVSKGILTSIELEGSDKSPVWRVEFITSDGTEHEVTVDGTSGKVTDHNKDKDDDTDDWNEAKAAADQAKTSLEDAAAAALDKVGKGTVTSVELDDDGNAQWDVDVTTEDGKTKEVAVDAANGKVTDVYTDDDDDDNDGDDDSDDDGDDD